MASREGLGGADSGDRLEAIADDFASRLRRGERPTVAEYAATHPDLADDLRTLLPSVTAMEELKVRQLTSTGRIGFLGLPSDRLGDFHILRELGRGGMGIVYEAEQESLGRRVALKTLPHTAFLSVHQVTRFRKEAETASRLQHPNIVSIFSVGADAGVHFFAMPLIEGVGLDRIIRTLEGSPDTSEGGADGLVAATLDWLQPPSRVVTDAQARRAGFWRRVAEIGAEVAEALEFAHQRGVLHRDIKPSNVLIEPHGKVWVTDFGIAKIRDEESLTRTGEFVGTLRYAPPEGLDGSFDARGDVYGLGLTLYELAARRPAFRSRSRRELAQQVRNGVVRSLRQVAPEAPRDLETIVAKATAFEPSHRYATAGLLADDLRRFAAGMPIRARDVSIIERLWRWSRRNPGIAVLATSTCVAVLAAAVIGWKGYLSTSRALERANSATARAEANLSLSLRSFDGLFDAIAGERNQGMFDEELSDVPMFPALSPKDVELLRRTLSFYEQFGAANANDVQLRLDTARAFRRIGDVHRWTGEVALAEAAYERAREHYDQQLRDRDDPGLLVELAAIHKNLGILHADLGSPARAGKHFAEARQILADEVKQRPSERSRYELARVLNAIGASMSRQEMVLRSSRGSTPAMSPMSPVLSWLLHVATYHQQAVSLAESLVAGQSDAPQYRLLLARSHRLLAQTLSLARGSNRPAAAIDESMRILAELATQHGDFPGYKYELAEANCLMGAVWHDATDGARRCRDGVRQARELVASHATVPQYQDLLARGLRRLAEVLARAGDTDESAAQFAESAELRAQLWERFSSAPHHLWELTSVRQSLAVVEVRRANFAQARRLLEAAIRDVESFGKNRSTSFQAGMALRSLRDDLVRVLTALGDTAAAEQVRAVSAAEPRRPGWPGPDQMWRRR